jgi:hypothetical protein
MKRKSYQFPPTPEQVEFINSDAVNALVERIAEAVTQTNNLDAPAIVWTLLCCAQNFIFYVEEDGDMLKAAKILHSLTRRLTKMRWAALPDGKVEDLVTGEKFSPTRQ